VVVKPETVSNTASTKRTSGWSASRNGSAPSNEDKNQNATTSTKPSRLRNSTLKRYSGVQHSSPKPKVAPSVSAKGSIMA